MLCVSLQVHIAYVPVHQHSVPSEQLKALVKTCSRRLQIQERLTQEIADGVDSLTGVHLTVLLHLHFIGLLALRPTHWKNANSTLLPCSSAHSPRDKALASAHCRLISCHVHAASCKLCADWLWACNGGPHGGMPFCRRRRRSCCMQGVSHVHGGSWGGEACQQHHHHRCSGCLPAAHSTASRHAAASYGVPG